MNILVVGNGGREHALAWSLLQSDRVTQVLCVPGNGGTATLPRCRNLPISLGDFAAIADLGRSEAVDLVVVGPEAPLAGGITDVLSQAGLTVFGPTQAGAQIEASKAWAKQLMVEAGIPTAQARVFTDINQATAYVHSQGAPIVIKADGLAAGKGVTVAATIDEAIAALQAIAAGQFGAAGQQVVIEECLTGQEVSVLALTDGHTIRALLPAQDHKRIGEGDTGANTGGMGAYAPAPIVTPTLANRIHQEILEPTIAALQNRGIDYRGILYAGLMITPAGDPKVIEFNCRFGDPETQAVLPLLDTPLVDLLLACTQQQLASQPEILWKPGAAVCVVMASGGYPGQYKTGYPIAGLEQAASRGAIVFHAGTRLQPDGTTIVTDGGRVLGITAIGADHKQAFALAYEAIASIQFIDSYYRRDIGYRVR
ncbi:MAG: phosphoribosylamine--glycine ligase [Cyanobacteria bacterium]|nr:phosphoribosylamine--glycine ligase [Cyanobacteriota bacterium]MDW8200676.1 phosphoribosylamine--glycine ligase [Cyanobacteriota bacterium SKYGB_h_bin112]